MVKCFFFEYVVNLFYRHVFTAPKSSYSMTSQLGATFTSGYAVSSLMGKAEHKGKSIGAVASEGGVVPVALSRKMTVRTWCTRKSEETVT